MTAETVFKDFTNMKVIFLFVIYFDIILINETFNAKKYAESFSIILNLINDSVSTISYGLI